MIIALLRGDGRRSSGKGLAARGFDGDRFNTGSHGQSPRHERRRNDRRHRDNRTVPELHRGDRRGDLPGELGCLRCDGGRPGRSSRSAQLLRQHRVFPRPGRRARPAGGSRRLIESPALARYMDVVLRDFPVERGPAHAEFSGGFCHRQPVIVEDADDLASLECLDAGQMARIARQHLRRQLVDVDHVGVNRGV